jgi:translation elongation factor EF-G
MNSLSELQKKVAELQNNYYSSHSKKTIFKSAQKNDCAASIAQQIDITNLIRHTIYNIPNTNRIFFDYTVFKTFATNMVFEDIINHLMQITEKCIDKYQSFEMHVNWNTYTISAHERYKNIYSLFTDKCAKSRFNFSDRLTHMFVYHVPTMIDTIAPIIRPFIDPKIISKIKLYSKNDSDQLLAQLLRR